MRCATIVMVIFGTTRCVRDSSTSDIRQAQSDDLTPEQAKAAMIELLRADQLPYMQGFPLDKFVNKPVEIYKDGSAGWRPSVSI